MVYLNGIKHLTTAETARLLGLSRGQVLLAIKNGKLKAHWHRYHLYIPQVEAERYLEEELNASVDRVAAKLFRARGLRMRLIFSWKNGHGRGPSGSPQAGRARLVALRVFFWWRKALLSGCGNDRAGGLPDAGRPGDEAER